ncbi:hypothetical protein MMC28_000137 [Mycoblastus sanguinarius]|nr:hypothetical protein [Mycoblastus sanguinarius]
MATQKIAVYSLPDLKNTTDDALPNYLISLKFKQSHFLTDVRLALGYTAVLIAATTFYADYQLGWEKTKAGTFWAVLIYFILNGALTFWIWGVEKGQVFVGELEHSSEGRCVQLSIASNVTKHTPLYNLTVRHTNGKGEETKTQLSAPFSRWFDVNGFFVAKPFQQWLASEIPIIGQVDPHNSTGELDATKKTNENSISTKQVEQQKLDAPKSSISSNITLGNAKPRKTKR